MKYLWNELANTASELQKDLMTTPEFCNKRHIIPNRDEVINILMEIRGLLFPCHFPSPIDQSNPVTLLEVLGSIQWKLARLIHDSIAHSCPTPCVEDPSCICGTLKHSLEQSHELMAELPAIRKTLLSDIQAAYVGDPAATGIDEIILSYTSVFAIMVYRIAHELHKMQVPIIPRIMTEYAHSRTGIDIHPGAQIGKSFFIDHGTGVVIGSTCVIGEHVKLYQGVTLGALSFHTDDTGQLIRNTKRHPTIEDRVTIYAGATVLGGTTVIGKDSIIGGNVWLTESVPPNSKVISRPVIEMR
jgi:serine O-acetyltransferase